MKNTLTFILLMLFHASLLASVQGQGDENNNPATASNRPNFAPDQPIFVPGELLVQFRADATDEDEARVLGKIKGEALEHVRTRPMIAEGRGKLVLIYHQPDLPQKAAINFIKDDPAVEFVEPNWIYTHQETSNDTYYNLLWGMYGDTTTPSNAYGSQAAEAWAAGCIGSANVYVGVIDEGIQYTHPDLQANVWTNGFDVPDGVDNDGNGYIDDINGWDFYHNDNTIYDGGTVTSSLDRHGTHVTGTIGGIGGNGIGIAGINWNVTYISAKILEKGTGGTTANAVKALDYITDLKTRHGLNIVATNNSYGGVGFSQAVLDAINRAGDAGILVIAAAGNGGSDSVGDDNDSSPFYPSSYQCTSNGKDYDCVISVAAITSDGSKSSFSNYGAASVDLGAPGSNIASTVNYNKYQYLSGTSMATPHVTGAAALYASRHPGATAAEIKAAILSSTIPTASLSGKTVTGGRLNVGEFCQ